MSYAAWFAGEQHYGWLLGTLLGLLAGVVLLGCTAQTGQVAYPTSVPPALATSARPSATVTATLFLIPTPTPPLRTIDPWGWLAGDPCAPPCWQHITPGQPLTDALQALSQTVPLNQLVNSSFPRNTEATLSWGVPFRYKAFIHYDTARRIVNEIVVRYVDDLAWEQLLGAYGEPEYVLIVAGMLDDPDVIAYGFGAVYLDEGLFLSSLDDQVTSLIPPNIGPHLRFDEVIFIKPHLAGLREYLGLEPEEPLPQRLVPWTGFQDFATYCQTTYPDEAAAICPSP